MKQNSVSVADVLYLFGSYFWIYLSIVVKRIIPLKMNILSFTRQMLKMRNFHAFVSAKLLTFLNGL